MNDRKYYICGQTLVAFDELMAPTEAQINKHVRELKAEDDAGPSLTLIEDRVNGAHVMQRFAFGLISRQERFLECAPVKCPLCRAAFERFKSMAMPGAYYSSRYHFVVWSITQDFLKAHHERWWLKAQTRPEHFGCRIKLREYPRILWEQAVTIGYEFLGQMGRQKNP